MVKKNGKPNHATPPKMAEVPLHLQRGRIVDGAGVLVELRRDVLIEGHLGTDGRTRIPYLVLADHLGLGLSDDQLQTTFMGWREGVERFATDGVRDYAVPGHAERDEEIADPPVIVHDRNGRALLDAGCIAAVASDYAAGGAWRFLSGYTRAAAEMLSVALTLSHLDAGTRTLRVCGDVGQFAEPAE